MSKTVITASTGTATVSIDNTAIVALMDKVSEGAASSFLKRAKAVMKPVLDAAGPTYPVDTGEAGSSLRMREDISETRIAVTALNVARKKGVDYGYKVRWSVRTKESLDAEAARVGMDDARFQEELRAIGDDPVGLARWFAKRNRRRWGPKDKATIWRNKLTRIHGMGAPNATVAGKNVWSYSVRRVLKQQERKLIEDVRADLDKLVKR